MSLSLRRMAALVATVSLTCWPPPSLQAADAGAAHAKKSLVEPYLLEGRLAEGEKALLDHLKKQPTDDEARLALGTLQFLRAIEGLSQDLYRYGARTPRMMGLPILRLAHGENPKPAKLSYEKARGVLLAFVARLGKAEKTLAEITDRQVKLPLAIGRVRMDLDGNGKAEPNETLAKVLQRVMDGRRDTEESLLKLTIAVDRADVHWLRGYCHLLMGLSEMLLAHDGKELFERTAQVLFPNVDTPYAFLKHTNGRGNRGWDFEEIADLVAMIHLINLPVKEPDRMKKALKHFKAVIAQSRQSWKFIEQEMDDDREWIPSPRQTSVLAGMKVSKEMVSQWRAFLDELETILDGKKLVPFWRGAPGQYGVNINKVFTAPRRFDLVLWVQGSGAAPFLEKGALTKPDFWRRLNDTFRGNFVGFAIWFN